MQEPRILAFAGSARSASFNKLLLRAVARGVEEEGVGCTLVDLRDHSLPVYDGDLEAAEGLPEAAVKLRALLLDHQGLLVATPEYNGGIPPLLKNVLDWVSRSPEANPDLSPYRDKLAALAAASPGPLGGMRGLVMTRTVLTNLGITVLANQMTLRQAAQAFGEDGQLVDEARDRQARALGAELAWAVRALSGSR